MVDAVADDHLCARVGPGVAADAGQVFLGEPDHLAVDLHHRRVLDSAVLQHAFEHAAIAGADDQHAPGRAVGQQRHMGEHFLIDELVGFGDLHHAVQQHDAAVGVTLDDVDVLES